MSDKDRAAFDSWWVKYYHGEPSFAWGAWKAARAHYAPKLTEKQAVEKVMYALFKMDHPGSEFENQIEMAWALEEQRPIAKVALKAAGLRFKEEV